MSGDHCEHSWLERLLPTSESDLLWYMMVPHPVWYYCAKGPMKVLRFRRSRDTNIEYPQHHASYVASAVPDFLLRKNDMLWYVFATKDYQLPTNQPKIQQQQLNRSIREPAFPSAVEGGRRRAKYRMGGLALEKAQELDMHQVDSYSHSKSQSKSTLTPPTTHITLPNKNTRHLLEPERTWSGDEMYVLSRIETKMLLLRAASCVLQKDHHHQPPTTRVCRRITKAHCSWTKRRPACCC